MTGGQDDAANLIHTSDGMTWDRWHEIRAENIALKERLRICREFLETAVRAWEACFGNVHANGWRAARLTVDWYVKSKEALGDE